MSIIDTPDGQYGTVAAQRLLGTFAGGVVSATVALPPNIETLLTFNTDGMDPGLKSIVGVTTGLDYNFSTLPAGPGGMNNPIYICSVVPVADAEVVITWDSAPADPWYVVADAAVRQYFDETLAQVVGLNGGPIAPNSSVLVAGLSSGFLFPLNLDGSGNLKVNVAVGGGGALSYQESFITADVPLTAFGTVYNVTSVALPSGVWLVNARALVTRTTANLAAVDVFLGPTSASVTGAYAATTVESGGVAGAAEGLTAVVSKLITLTTLTTVYLEAVSTAISAIVRWESQGESLPNASGISAVKIA